MVFSYRGLTGNALRLSLVIRISKNRPEVSGCLSLAIPWLPVHSPSNKS